MSRRSPERPKRKSGPGAQETGELRLIGGRWRSRKLTFPAVDGVRPTPARTRETLFNWLAPHIEGACCLDLFAGSGALGLEALSRGAAQVTLVDRSRDLSRALRMNLSLLGGDSGEVICNSAEAYLSLKPTRPWDIIFLDPPFRQGWLDQILPRLYNDEWVKPGGWIYAEQESEARLPGMPAGWMLHREKTAGQVRYLLIRSPREEL